MKIAMFTNNYKPYIGGVPISIEHLAEALRQRGHQVWIFAPSYAEQEEEPYVIRYPSFPVTIVGAPIPNILTTLFFRKMKELQIEVIHVHHPAIVGNVALELKRRLGIPVVFTYHTRYEAYLHYIAGLQTVEMHTGLLEKYMRYFCSHCDLLIAPTPGIRTYLEEQHFKTPIAVLPTGIPEESFLPDEKKAAQIKADYQREADYLFCTVSRLAKEKNLYFQMEGLACLKRLLKKEGKTFRHLVIGTGPEEQALKRRVGELGLSENVFFVGNVENREIKNYQAASDLFLFTSKSETQGIVLLEAMAVKNPVLAVDASGVRDVVNNGENGYLTAEDTYAWARKIAEVRKDREEMQVLRAGAEKTAEAYAEDVIARQAEQCYKEVCGREAEETNRISIFHRYVV